MVYQVGSTTTIITGLFVNFSLKQLWIQKNVMQVIVQLKVFKQLPANLASLLEALNDAVYFKFTYFVGEKLIRDHFATEDFEFQQVQKEYMTRWGVEDTSWFWSLGIFAVLLIVLVLLLMIYFLLKLW